MERGRVTVVGSANLDHVVRVSRSPAVGETISARDYTTTVGGKGLNQAVAAARAGAQARFVGAIGHDAAGARIREVVVAAGIDPADLLELDGIPTGTAHIVVDDDGDNRIVVAAGANAALGRAWIERRGVDADVVMLQLEIDRAVATAAAQQAKAAGARVILTPAPLGDEPLSHALLSAVDVLAVNRLEADLITGGEDIEALLDIVPAVLLTDGARGATWVDRSGAHYRVPGRPVRVVDTTAAGDVFAGYLAAELARATPPEQALAIANAAAALSVGRSGAVESIPGRAEVGS